MTKLHYNGHRKRLRARLLASEKSTLPDYEILEILLFSASSRADVKPLAKELLAIYGSFAKVIASPQEELLQIKGVNEAVLASFRVVQEASERLAKSEIASGNILESWEQLIKYCRITMAHSDKEQFRVIFLDAKNKIIADKIQSSGTVDHVAFYPREIVKQALQYGALSLILVHNHPTGDVTPSQQDIEITRNIASVTENIGITLHDHIIISKNGYFSFQENGIK